MPKALRKIAKADKRRAAELRHELWWLENWASRVWPFNYGEQGEAYRLCCIADIKADLGGIYGDSRRKEEPVVTTRDARGLLAEVKDQFAPQIEQYKRGETKVLSYLIGALVKQGCDPIQAKEAWLKELN